jgi:hypothetical protein
MNGLTRKNRNRKNRVASRKNRKNNNVRKNGNVVVGGKRRATRRGRKGRKGSRR